MMDCELLMRILTHLITHFNVISAVFLFSLSLHQNMTTIKSLKRPVV
jgi:hypothetical protein